MSDGTRTPESDFEYDSQFWEPVNLINYNKSAFFTFTPLENYYFSSNIFRGLCIAFPSGLCGHFLHLDHMKENLPHLGHMKGNDRAARCVCNLATPWPSPTYPSGCFTYCPILGAWDTAGIVTSNTRHTRKPIKANSCLKRIRKL